MAQVEGITIGCGKLKSDSWMSNTPRVSWILTGGKTSLARGKTFAWDLVPVSDGFCRGLSSTTVLVASLALAWFCGCHKERSMVSTVSTLEQREEEGETR